MLDGGISWGDGINESSNLTEKPKLDSFPASYRFFFVFCFFVSRSCAHIGSAQGVPGLT